MLSDSEFKNSLEYIIYFQKDFEKASKILKSKFEIFLDNLPQNKKMGNKHKCDKNNKCECIKLGIFLIDISINNNQTPDLLKVLELYYYNPGINLPYSLFKHLCINMVKILNFQNLRPIIENYIIYSKSLKFNLEPCQNEELLNILIFDVILVTGGFNQAKSKINSSFTDEILKQKFLDKFNKILEKYTREKNNKENKGDSLNNNSKNLLRDKNTDIKSNSEIDDYFQSSNIYNNNSYDRELYSKLNNIVENKFQKNFEFGNKYSDYIIKNSK